MPQLFAEVAVNSTFPHRQTFSYAVPGGLVVQPGHAVYVPFGRLTLQGIVLEVHDTPVFSEPEKIRAIRSLIGERPLLDDDRVGLAKWIADYYVAPVFSAVALMLPPGFERKPVTLARPLVEEDEVEGLELPERQREALAAIAKHASVDMDGLRAQLSFSGVEAAVAQLERRELVVRTYELQRPRIGPKTVEKLERMGIRSLADLRAHDPVALERAFGPRMGGWLQARARFEDETPISVVSPTVASSASWPRTLSVAAASR